MLTLGFVGLAMFVGGFLLCLLNMFINFRNPERMFSGGPANMFTLHLLGMAFVFLGGIMAVVGFAPTAWELLLQLIDHAKK